MNKASEERLSRVHPELARRVTQVLASLRNLGMQVEVVEGLRTYDEQNKIYQQGRTRPGPIVTNAPPGFSNHNFGLAVDLCPFNGGKPDWNDRRAFATIGREAKALGLEWGGDWKFTDMPHVQLRGMSVKECQAFYQRGGLKAVWGRMDQMLQGAKPTEFIPTVDDVLEFGDKGIEIINLQNDLVALGLLRTYEVDGEFGKVTKAAVVAFQRQAGATADGIVGPGTKAKLKAALLARRQPFKNLTPAEIDAAVAPSTPITAVPTSDPVDTAVIPPSEAPVVPTLETLGAPQWTGELNQPFEPLTLPAFIPRFGKQWLSGLLPAFGFIATFVAYLKSLPPWVVLAFSVISAAATVGFFYLLAKHREKVADFITGCYAAIADPTKHNLIPTNAGPHVGKRTNAILTALDVAGKVGEIFGKPRVGQTTQAASTVITSIFNKRPS